MVEDDKTKLGDEAAATTTTSTTTTTGEPAEVKLETQMTLFQQQATTRN